MYFLIDGNNFFVSCERIFRPHLGNKPVVVLSNNDGCIVARSNEVKAMGVPMGAPIFEWRKFLEKNHVHIFSSNFQFYGDISHRFIQILGEFSPQVDVYSIDEAFLEFSENYREQHHLTWEEWGTRIQNRVQQCLGIPVSVGIAPTKTLAKLATELIKNKMMKSSAVKVILPETIDDEIQNVPVGQIWGVGRQSAHILKQQGIHTALDFKNASPAKIKKILTITGSRTQKELQGIPCFDLNDAPTARQSIVCSRSFGKIVTDAHSLKEALSDYVAKACEKMRAQKSLVQYISVFAYGGQGSLKQYYVGSQKLSVPLDFTPEITRLAWRCVDGFYKKGVRYKKIGIMLADLIPHNKAQYNLFETNFPCEQKNQLMKTLDAINKKWGDHTLQYASQGFKRDWESRSLNRSPCYTTRWSDLPKVKA